MTAPETWKSRTGEVWVLAEVAPVLRQAAITISFGTGDGPWWTCLPIARQVMNDAANAYRQAQDVWEEPTRGRLTARAVNAEHALHEVRRAVATGGGHATLPDSVLTLIDQTLADAQSSTPTPRRATE